MGANVIKTILKRVGLIQWGVKSCNNSSTAITEDYIKYINCENIVLEDCGGSVECLGVINLVITGATETCLGVRQLVVTSGQSICRGVNNLVINGNNSINCIGVNNLSITN